MELTVNFKIDPLVIKIDVNPQFTQSICYLATAFGYPAQTIANELKETAKEIKAKAEEPKQQEQLQKQEEIKPVEKPKQQKQDVKKWTSEELVNLCNDLCLKQKVITLEDIKRVLKKFKDKNGNPISRVQELDFEKVEEVNEFVRIINEQASLQKANILSEK